MRAARWHGNGDRMEHMPAPGKTYTILIRVDQVARLFNSLDPTPFRERDLDDDAERFIVEWAQEAPGKVPIEIVVQLPPTEVNLEYTQTVRQAVRYNFESRADQARRELREIIREGTASPVRRHSYSGGQSRRKPIDQRCRGDCRIFACHRRRPADLRLGGQLARAGDLPLWLVADRAPPPALSPPRRGRGQGPVGLISSWVASA